MRKTIVAGNWKMNASKESVNTLIEGILSGMNETSSEVIVCAPFPYLSQVESLIQGSSLMLGAQNLNVNSAGAYTGEVSADMIKDFGAQYVIVGHSERRQLFHENDQNINKKIKAILSSGLKPILCIGETIGDRKSGLTEDFLQNQLEKNLEGVESIDDCIIAYEPIWAIGTGETANKDQIYKTHNFINSVLKKIYPKS